MWGFLIAALSGALMSIQGVFNTAVTRQAGIWVSNGWVQFSALLTCVALWFFMGRDALEPLWKTSPWYMLSGGVIGAGITYTVIKSIEGLGPAKAIMVIVVSQLLVAYLIEAFGWFGVEQTGFEWKKVLGMALSIAGIIVFKWQ